MWSLFLLLSFVGTVKSQYDSSDGPVFSSCGSDITVDKGVITSPEYPGNYPNNQMCRWRVMTQVSNVQVRVTLDDLDIENARNCQYDFMSLRFADEAEQKFCGRTVEGNPHEGSLPLVVNFESDGSVGGKGFAMTFQGRLRIQCMVRVTDLQIWESPSCVSDFVRLVFHGTGGRAYRLCGENPGSTRNTTGPSPLEVYMQTDKMNVSKGFRLIFAVLSPCLSEPCQNGASCKYDNDSYTCECAEGWEGVNCDSEINECQSDPCQNGGRCTDEVNRFTCTCSPGVTGTTCDVISDYCAHLRPCANGATCESVEASYVCTCAEGYTGRNCDAEVDECASSPCENGGTCNDMFARYQCDCVEGYRGERCEILPTTTTAPPTTTTASTVTKLSTTTQPLFCGMTSSIVCLNGGSCVVVDGMKEACLCPDGFDGNRCENLAKDSPDYLNALIATSVGSLVCVLLMGAIVCLVLCKRKHANRCEVMQLGRRGGPGAENQVANANKPQQAREAWGARHQTAINDNNWIGRPVEDESSHYDSKLLNFAPGHYGCNGFYPANGFRQSGVQVGGKRRHSVVDDYSKPQADKTFPVYSVMQTMDAHRKDNNMDANISSKPKTNREGREQKHKAERRQHPSRDVKIAPDAAATLINYLSNALKMGKPNSGKRSHDKSSSEALAIKSIVSDATTNQNPSPRQTDQSQRQVDKARHRGHFKVKRGEEDDVRMDNLKLYDYFDQFASDKQGRAVLRLTRENAFLFE